MFDRRRLIVSGAALAAAASAPAIAAAAEPQFLAFRFAMRGRQPVTGMMIGKNGPYLVLLDTGDLFGPVLKLDIATKLDLRSVGTARVYGAAGTDSGTGYQAHQVVFGGALLAQDLVFLGSKETGSLDGVAPLSLFTLHATQMDFEGGIVRVQTSGSPNWSGFRAVRCEHMQEGKGFIADVEVEGVTARLLVDTGAENTLQLDPSFVRKHQLWDKHPKFLDLQFKGITDRIARSRLVRTASVKFGPYKFTDVPVELADPQLTLLSSYDGVIGIELLRRFTLGFDAAGSTVWLRPNGALADAFVYDHSGLTWSPSSVGVVVKATAPGSPAEAAGLKPGDRLIELDTTAKARAFEARLSAPPGTDLAFDIARDNKRMPIKMTLQDWL